MGASAADGAEERAWICYLCQRKFGSEEMLKKHGQLSKLHKDNLEKERKAD